MALVVVLLIAGLFVTGTVSVAKFENLFHSNNTKQKAQVVVLTDDVSAAKKALADAQAAQAAADANQKAVDAANRAKQVSQHEFVHGTALALSKEINPSIYVQVAAVLNNDADRSFDSLPADKAAEIAALVDSLTSADKVKVLKANEQLSTLQAQLSDEQAKEHSLELQQVVLVSQKDVLASAASALQARSADDAKSLAKWAADNQTLAQRLKSFVLWASIFCGLYFLVFYVLPALGKEFPALVPVAKTMSAVGAWPLHVLREAELEMEKLAHSATAAKLVAVASDLTAEQKAHASTTAALVSVSLAP